MVAALGFPGVKFHGPVRMNDTVVIEIFREAIWLSVQIAGPVLLAILLVGILVGIFQAATSINEMTISFVPKLIVVALLMILLGKWQLQLLVDFTHRILERVAEAGQ